MYQILYSIGFSIIIMHFPVMIESTSKLTSTVRAHFYTPYIYRLHQLLNSAALSL